MLAKGFAQTTLEFKISFVRPITPETGLVTAEGNIISCGRRVATASPL
jgi:acyl-coenzyme A thioesterase PaaI-like protein